MTEFNYQPLIEATRGPIVESVHYGSIAVVDATGKLVASCGSPDGIAFLRSSAKPFQAIPVLESGVVEHFGLNEEETAILCASHSGSDRHVAVIEGMHQKIGIKESDLMCGTHPPSDSKAKIRMILENEEPGQRRHNCSGKHTGMLAQALMRGVPIKNYIALEHPVQQADLHVFAEMCDVRPEDVKIGIDGCSVPVYAIPLRNAAYGFARLMDPRSLSDARARTCHTITHAMAAYPFMIAGEGEFDTVLMEVFGGKIISKGGAEGYQALGIQPGVLSPDSPGVGIAIKIADGDVKSRARVTVAIEVLRQLGLKFSPQQIEKLAAFDTRPVENWRGLKVGEFRPAFVLSKYEA